MRQRLWILIVASIAIPAWSDEELGPSGIELLRPGSFHGDEVRAESGETWLGLFPTEEGFTLKPCQIDVDEVYDVVLHRETGKRVSVSGAHAPLFLIRGLSGLSTGNIPTVVNQPQSLMPGESVSVGAENAPFDLSVTGKFLSREEQRLLINYQIQITDGSQTQILFQEERPTTGSMPSLIWAGDLDNDGRLDFLIDTVDKLNKSNYSLFLSTSAGQGQLLGLAAAFRSNYR